MTYFVFPSVTHTRFEHSLGVSHLARNLLQQLKNKQPELEIEENDIELVQIATELKPLQDAIIEEAKIYKRVGRKRN